MTVQSKRTLGVGPDPLPSVWARLEPLSLAKAGATLSSRGSFSRLADPLTLCKQMRSQNPMLQESQTRNHLSFLGCGRAVLSCHPFL